MNISATLRDFLIDKEYYIDLYLDYIHVYGYKKIILLDDKKIIIEIDKYYYSFIGDNFLVVKLNKEELLCKGILKEMRKKSVVG